MWHLRDIECVRLRIEMPQGKTFFHSRVFPAHWQTAEKVVLYASIAPTGVLFVIPAKTQPNSSLRRGRIIRADQSTFARLRRWRVGEQDHGGVRDANAGNSRFSA